MVAVTSAACASSSRPGSVGCESGLRPHTASVEPVLDSASLQEDLEATWRPGIGLAVASVEYDPEGTLGNVNVWSETMPEGMASTVEDQLRQAASAAAPPLTDIDLFLGDVNGPVVRRVEGLKVCMPRLKDEALVVEELGRRLRRVDFRGRIEVSLLAFVDGEGRVLETRVWQSSGRADLDLVAANALRAALFVPGRLEGMSVPLWVRFPVRMRVR